MTTPYNPYLEALRAEVQRLENISAEEISEAQQIMLDDLSKELELLTRGNNDN